MRIKSVKKNSIIKTLKAAHKKHSFEITASLTCRISVDYRFMEVETDMFLKMFGHLKRLMDVH